MSKKCIIMPEWDEIFNNFMEEGSFSNHAFPLFLFTSRLYDALVTNNVKNVFFMSREGQFLKVLFEKYVEIRKTFGLPVAEISTHYFLGSRNSIMTASVKTIEEENFDYLFKFFNFFMTPSRFLYSIGFSNDQINMVKSNSKLNLDKICFSLKSSKLLKKLLKDQTFRDIYEKNRVSQSNAFSNYMNTFKVDYYSEGLVFVDIGYHGTMQDLIFKFFDNKVKTTGYFIKSRAINTDNNKKIGLLGDKNNKALFGGKITRYDSFNYEQILRADHGRCLGYETTGNLGTPILDKEFKDKDIFDKYVKSLQDRILQKFEMIANKYFLSPCNIEALCVIYYYYTIKNKTKLDYDWILDMQDCHHDDFGYVGYPGKFFARNLRKLTFKIKDKIFVLKYANYIRKLRKQYNKSK